MRLLWLTPEVPEPGGTGGAVRAFHLLRALVHRGDDVTVVAPAYPDQAERARATAEAGVELRLVRRPLRQPLEAVEAIGRDPGLLAGAVRDPWLGWQAGAFWTRVGPTALRVLGDRRPDAAIVEHDFVAAWGRHLPPNLPAGLATQNAFWEYYTGRAEVAVGLARVAARAEAARFRRYVARALPRFGWVGAVSEEDRRSFAALGAARTDLVPNGVDAGRVAAVPPGGGREGALLFTGTLSYPPNAEGIVWFAEEVLPRIRAARPDVTLTVVGRDAPAAVRRLASIPGVELTGWVEDIAACFAAARVVIAPLRSGGGTKLKVLEALAAGRPLVATPVAAQGIAVDDGRHLLVRADAAAFADGVLALLGDPGQRDRLATEGRAAVLARYDWEAIGGALHEALRRWLGD